MKPRNAAALALLLLSGCQIYEAVPLNHEGDWIRINRYTGTAMFCSNGICSPVKVFRSWDLNVNPPPSAEPSK